MGKVNPKGHTSIRYGSKSSYIPDAGALKSLIK